MSELTKDLLFITSFLILFDLVFVFQYFFPHFSMHFFREAKFGGMGLNSGFFTGKCNHSKNDIEKFKKRQVPMIITMSIPVVLMFVVIINTL